jgi:hypothetical protein
MPTNPAGLPYRRVSIVYQYLCIVGTVIVVAEFLPVKTYKIAVN